MQFIRHEAPLLLAQALHEPKELGQFVMVNENDENVSHGVYACNGYGRYGQPSCP